MVSAPRGMPMPIGDGIGGRRGPGCKATTLVLAHLDVVVAPVAWDVGGATRDEPPHLPVGGRGRNGSHASPQGQFLRSLFRTVVTWLFRHGREADGSPCQRLHGETFHGHTETIVNRRALRARQPERAGAGLLVATRNACSRACFGSADASGGEHLARHLTPAKTIGPLTFVEEKLNRSDNHDRPGDRSRHEPAFPLALDLTLPERGRRLLARWPEPRSTSGTRTREASTPTSPSRARRARSTCAAIR